MALIKQEKTAIPDYVNNKVLFVSFRDGEIRISQNIV